LVETDPQFTQLKTWLGSDYMLKSLSMDPTITQKRLGDGFYEQKLIREQVAQLTGRRFSSQPAPRHCLARLSRYFDEQG